MAQHDLKQKAATGMVWTALQKFSVTLITFVSDIILARLLTPYDFGCIEMLAIFVLLSETIVNGGFGDALIQRKRPSQEDYSTIFYWSMVMAGIIYAILYFTAPSISFFYAIPELKTILRVQGLILFLYAFNVIQVCFLKKQFRFKTLSVITIVSSVISLAFAIWMAYAGYGVWALVAKNLLAAGLTSLICWFFVKWRPVLVFSWKSFKELFGFGFYMFLSNIVTTFSSKIQGLLIGKFYNPSTMGFYSKASGTEGVVSTTLKQVMDQVTYPLYAEVQDNMAAMQNMVKRFTMTLSYITFPLLFIFMLVAKPLFILLYTEKWLPSVPYFQVLCIAGLGQCLQSVNFQTISAIGKSKIVFKWTMIKRILGIGFIVGGLVLWGMRGLLCGAVLNAWFAYFVNMGLVSKHIGYKWWRQILDLTPVLIASVVIAALSFLCIHFIELNLYIEGIVIVVVYVILYLVWSLVFKPEAFAFTLSVAKMFLSKMPKKNKKEKTIC